MILLFFLAAKNKIRQNSLFLRPLSGQIAGSAAKSTAGAGVSFLFNCKNKIDFNSFECLVPSPPRCGTAELVKIKSDRLRAQGAEARRQFGGL
jgi:hypothetical protein